MTEPRTESGLPRGVLILVALAAAIVVAAGMRTVSDILGPVFLALVLTISATPLRTVLVRRGAPRWLGTAAAILAVYIGIVALVASMVVSAARFADILPQYQDELNRLLNNLHQALADLGVGDEQLQAMFAELDLSQLAGWITSLLANMLSLLTNVVFIAMLVLFMCIDSTSFVRQLERFGPDRAAFVRAVESFTKDTRKYFIVSTAFGFVVAAIDTVFLWAVGVPGALLWGLLAFITNYIPNIGFIIGLIPPALLGLLEGGPSLFIAVIIVYSVINFVIQSLIQPKLVGDAVGMSASVTFLSLVIWAWIIGPLGAILAIPLSLLAKALLVDIDPTARWMSGLLGDKRLDTPA